MSYISETYHPMLMELARREVKANSGARRYVVARRWEQCGTHGWTYHILTEEQYMRHALTSWVSGQEQPR